MKKILYIIMCTVVGLFASCATDLDSELPVGEQSVTLTATLDYNYG